LAIGVGAAIDPQLAILIAIATAFDNLSEGLNIGQLYRSGGPGDDSARTRWKIVGWTSLIGSNDPVGAGLGWFVLRDASPEVLAFVFATAAGGMFYIAITDLVPIAQARHYQQSAGLATVGGFMLALALASVS